MKRQELLLLEMIVLKSSGTDQKFPSTEPWPAQDQHVRSDLEDKEGWRVEWGLLLSGFFVLLFCPQYWDCCETISFSLIVPFHHSIPYNGTLLTAFNGEVWRKDDWVWIAGGYLRLAGLHALLSTSQDQCGGTRWGWWVRGSGYSNTKSVSRWCKKGGVRKICGAPLPPVMILGQEFTTEPGENGQEVI